MSVLPPFTYPSLSLRSHRVITVHCDLQIFPCVPYVATLETETFGVPMTFGAIHHHLEASCAEVTFGAVRRTKSPLSNPTSPRPQLGRSLAA
jgi:hypothetical protein